MPFSERGNYDTETLETLEANVGKVKALLRERGYRSVEPSILQPADIFLDWYGEEIRGRIYAFNDPGGHELCLRPDLTIPTCRMYLECGGQSGAPARLCYNGTAFRYQPYGSGRPSEFYQTGFEYFGETDAAAADAEVMVTARAACRELGLDAFDVQMGDLGLFAALVDAVDLPDQWRPRLKRQFSRPSFFRQLIEQLKKKENGEEREAPGRRSKSPAFLTALGTLSEDEARADIRDVLAVAEISSVGGRSVEEIAERFLEQAADASAAAMPVGTVDLIDAFLQISDTPAKALSAIEALIKDAGLDMSAALDRIKRRLDAIQKAGFGLENARFATALGRAQEYYTGLVFEFHVPALGAMSQVAGGGRYDHLLKRLGAPRDIPAVGCAIRTERIITATRPNGEGAS